MNRPNPPAHPAYPVAPATAEPAAVAAIASRDAHISAMDAFADSECGRIRRRNTAIWVLAVVLSVAAVSVTFFGHNNGHSEIAALQSELGAAKTTATIAKTEADKAKADAIVVKTEAEKAKAELVAAVTAKGAADKARSEAELILVTAKAKADQLDAANGKLADADKAKDELARKLADAEKFKTEADKKATDLEKKLTAATKVAPPPASAPTLVIPASQQPPVIISTPLAPVVPVVADGNTQALWSTGPRGFAENVAYDPAAPKWKKAMQSFQKKCEDTALEATRRGATAKERQACTDAASAFGAAAIGHANQLQRSYLARYANAMRTAGNIQDSIDIEEALAHQAR